MKFIILGSRIDNLANAYLLAKSGHQVTVLESENDKKNIPNDQILFNDNPVAFLAKQQNNLKSKICNILCQKTINPKINDLILKNKEAFENLLNTEKITLKNKKDGLIYLYDNNKKLHNHIKQIAEIPDYQLFCNIFTESQLESLDLDLKYRRKKIIGAILLKNSFTFDKKSFINDLKEICKKKYKVKFEENLEITNIFTNHKKITGINTNKKVFVADHYIININHNNLDLLKSINLKIQTQNCYKIKIFSNIKNINNKIKYNLIDSTKQTIYSKNGNYYQIENFINKKIYQNINSNLGWNYFNQISKSNLLDIKDYKNIQYYLVKEQYFLKQLPLISKSTKYSNLFLNGGYGSISCNLSFGAAHSILQKETSKN